MTNKRHAAPPRAPSPDPDTGEPVQNVAPANDSPPPSAGAPGSVPAAAPAPTAVEQSEVGALKDRNLRLAAEYDNFRMLTTKVRLVVRVLALGVLRSRR